MFLLVVLLLLVKRSDTYTWPSASDHTEFHWRTTSDHPTKRKRVDISKRPANIATDLESVISSTEESNRPAFRPVTNEMRDVIGDVIGSFKVFISSLAPHFLAGTSMQTIYT